MGKERITTDIFVSVDIEANGPIPGEYSMTSFGAFVAGTQDSNGVITQFSPEEHPEYSFYRQLKPISDSYDQESYMVGLIDGLPHSAPASVRHQFLKDNGNDPRDAMEDFNRWLTQITEKFGPGSRVVFAAYPLGFDWMFIYWYLIQFTNKSAFGFSSFFDMKTAYKIKAGTTIGKSIKRFMPSHLFSSRPHTHHALDDAIEQGEFLMNLLRWDGT